MDFHSCFRCVACCGLLAAAQIAEARTQSAASATAPADASFEQVHHLAEQGKFDEALAALNGIASADPSRKNLAHELFVTYYRKGDYLAAVTYLKRTINENPA